MIKWVKATTLPKFTNISEFTAISEVRLVWMIDEYFTVASAVRDNSNGRVVWLAGSEGYDITNKVTHWAETFEGPTSDD